jgi:excinuclease UvrABC nuclease subunit
MDEQQRSLFESCLQIDPSADPAQSIAEIPHCRGVILFADADDAPILLLTAADIKRLAHNRLTCADTTVATKRVKLAEIVRRIYYLCCWCEFNSGLQHYRIAKKLFPSRYADLVTFPKIWYVKIHLDTKWPYFSVTDNPRAGRNVHLFGPLPSRRAAGDYINSLNEAFALCRQQCLIDDPAKAAGCPYFQMRLCGAPCAGNISRDEYLDHVRDAAQAAGGNRRGYVKKLEGAMRILAAKMEFEEAQITKKQLDQLKALDDDAYRWVCDMRQLSLLHIDAGPKIKVKGQKKKTQTYMAFLVRSGRISRLDDFTAEQIPQLLEALSSAVAAAIEDNEQDVREQMSLVGFALYRSKPSGLWIDCRIIPTADEMANIILKKFVDDGAGTEEDVDGHQD